jgi:hypothetical protein
MTTTLEQTAQELASQRAQVAKQQFESAYPDILAPLRGSNMSYAPGLIANSEVITFSKPGIPDTHLHLLPSGQVATRKQEALEPDRLVSYLAKHILTKEQQVAYVAKRQPWIQLYNWVVSALATALAIVTVVGVAVAVSLPSTPYGPATQFKARLLIGFLVTEGVLVVLTLLVIQLADAFGLSPEHQER